MCAAAALIMAIVPAHIMRSVGGGYDNESIALTAMCATFYCWVRALRTEPAVKDGKLYGRRSLQALVRGTRPGGPARTLEPPRAARLAPPVACEGGWPVAVATTHNSSVT